MEGTPVEVPVPNKVNFIGSYQFLSFQFSDDTVGQASLAEN
jgi:hypothetical protein